MKVKIILSLLIILSSCSKPILDNKKIVHNKEQFVNKQKVNDYKLVKTSDTYEIILNCDSCFPDYEELNDKGIHRLFVTSSANAYDNTKLNKVMSTLMLNHNKLDYLGLINVNLSHYPKYLNDKHIGFVDFTHNRNIELQDAISNINVDTMLLIDTKPQEYEVYKALCSKNIKIDLTDVNVSSELLDSLKRLDCLIGY